MLISLSVLGLQSTNPGTKSSLALSLAFPGLPLTASSPLLAALRTWDNCGHVCLHTHFEYPGTKQNGTKQRFEFVASVYFIQEVIQRILCSWIPSVWSRFFVLSPRYPLQVVVQGVTQNPTFSKQPMSLCFPLILLFGPLP